MEQIVNTDTAREIYRQLLHSWNARNAGAMAELFAENGTLIGFDGTQLNSREEISNVMTEIFAHHPTADYVAIVKSTKELAPGSAMLTAVVGMVAKGQKEIAAAVNALQTLVVTIENGSLKIALFQNTPAAYHGRPELCDQLTDDLQVAMGDAFNAGLRG